MVFMFCAVCGMQAAAAECGYEIENKIAYQEQGKFCGWPANEGIWSWGDEILAGFEISGYVKNDSGHSIDRESPKAIYFVRSLDGGQTWTVEKPAEIAPPAYLEDPNMFKAGDSQLKKLTEKVNFAHPDFAMKLRGNNYYYSYDRGKSWEGAYELPSFGQKLVMARTDYIVSGKDECTAFISTSNIDGNYGQSCGITTTDGGLTWKMNAWISGEFPPTEYKRFSFSIMPSTVVYSENKLISSLRQRFEKDFWIDVYCSDDNGRSWQFMSKAAKKINNPPSLLKLKDGRLCLTYCSRIKPEGLRAVISSDGGKSWTDEIVLRNDALSWDVGYVSSVERPDGKVVCLYYYHTAENPAQHIAATIWKP